MIINNNKTIFTLAPMAGQGDAVFRRICRYYGADGATSEMISAKGLYYHDASTAALAKITPDDTPLALQIFGHEPDVMAYAAATLASCEYDGGDKALPPSAIDINMGCPVKKIVSNGDGSALARNISLAAEVVYAAVRAAEPYGIPVTVKIRSGWDDAHINAVGLAHACEESGVSAITVHGRTREQQYSGKADMNIIAAVKRAVSIPVYANGDVKCSADAIRTLEITGADGIAIARGAVGAPWIFAEIKSALGIDIPDGIAEIINGDADSRGFLCCAAMIHARAAVEANGTHGLREIRPHLAAYLRGFDGAASLRAAAVVASSLDELACALEDKISDT